MMRDQLVEMQPEDFAQQEGFVMLDKNYLKNVMQVHLTSSREQVVKMIAYNVLLVNIVRVVISHNPQVIARRDITVQRAQILYKR
mmetsp:Transcript_26649/g.4736  ORF Transcript_26649/g.4736 Transcript_26649/m.4736 type:complete len:85 (+) Transcript_26649:392-646(+)